MAFSKFAFAAGAVAAISLAAGAAQAAVTVYDNAAAFSHAVSGTTTYGFAGIGESDWYEAYTNTDLTVGPATFDAPDRVAGNASTKGTLFVFGDQYYGNEYGSTAFLSSQGLAGTKASLDVSLSAPVYAIGFDIGSYTTSNAATSIFVNGVDVADLILPAAPASRPFQTEFVGFVSAAPITSIAFDNASAPAIDVTDFVIGAPQAVPEPAAWTLMLAGVGLAGAALRRRTARGASAA